MFAMNNEGNVYVKFVITHIICILGVKMAYFCEKFAFKTEEILLIKIVHALLQPYDND